MTRPGLLDPVAAQVETTLFRAIAVLRVVVATYAIALNLSRWHEFEHPVAGWVALAVIVAWTLTASWAYDAPWRRTRLLLVVDVAIAVATLLATPYVESDAMLARHASTIPSFWVMTAVLAWAVVHGWAGGLAAAVLMSVVDVSVRNDPNGTTWGNIFLLLLAAGIVGYSSTLIREATEARAEAERIAAALSERARLARAVHDGVLQVLALVQRRGTDLGGDAADLGRLAGEQEAVLRALVQGSGSGQVGGQAGGQAGGHIGGQVRGPLPAPGGPGGAGTADLVEELAPLASRTVTVSGPGGAVPLPAEVVRELVCVARACLDNVARHVGPEVSAWVLVERLADRVVLTVRDEGPGIAAGRLERAAADGRLGVSESIRGRMAALGGVAELTTGPGQGTEWELTVHA